MTLLSEFMQHPTTQEMIAQAINTGFNPASDKPADMFFVSIDLCDRQKDKGTPTLEIVFEIPEDAPNSIRAWPVLDVYEAGIELHKGSAQDSEWFTVPKITEGKSKLTNEILSTLHNSTGENTSNERIKLSVINVFVDTAIAFSMWANEFTQSQRKVA